MVANVNDPLADLQAEPPALAATLARVRRDDAAEVTILGEAASRALARTATELEMDQAESVAGATGREVYQDFKLRSGLPEGHVLHRLAQHLEGSINAALAQMGHDAPLEQIAFNEHVLQVYPPGSTGITPHRDQGRYRGLIAILCLSGDGPLRLCDDRSGSNAVTLCDGPGQLALLKAPDFDGGKRQPLHFVGPTRAERVSLSLRHDRRLLARSDG